MRVFLILFIVVTSGVSAGGFHLQEGTLVSYNETHMKVSVGKKIKTFPLKDLPEKYHSGIEKYLGKKVEVRVQGLKLSPESF